MTDPTAPLFAVATQGVRLIGVMVAIILFGPLLFKFVLNRFSYVVRFSVLGIMFVICISYLFMHKRAKDHQSEATTNGAMKK